MKIIKVFITCLICVLMVVTAGHSYAKAKYCGEFSSKQTACDREDKLLIAMVATIFFPVYWVAEFFEQENATDPK